MGESRSYRGCRVRQVAVRNFPVLALVALGGLSCSVPVAQGLDEATANQVVASLERGGVHASKEPDRQNEKLWRILVLPSMASEAILLMAAEGPGRKQSPGLLESMGDSALVPSPRAEELRMLAGTAGELERSLQELDGVKSARVHLAVAATDPLSEATNLSPTTASVLVRHRAEQAPISIIEVKRLVAGAVAGLTEDRVSVVLKPVFSSQLAAQPFARIGPLLVSRASATPLRWILSIALLTNIGLTAVLLWFWARQRRHSARRLASEEN